MRRSSNNSIFNPRARPIVSTLLQFTRNPPKYKGRGMNEVDRGESVSPVLSHECSNPSVPLSCTKISTPSRPAANLAVLQLGFSHIGSTPPRITSHNLFFSMEFLQRAEAQERQDPRVGQTEFSCHQSECAVAGPCPDAIFDNFRAGCPP